MIALEIPRRADRCCQCGHKLLHGVSYHSSLFNNAEGQRQRQDFCLSCWEQFMQAISKTESHWRSKTTAPTVSSHSFKTREERALELLKLADLTPAEQYLLALLLLRKRHLLFRKDIEEQGVSYQQFEISATKEILTIPKVSLASAEIPPLQKALAEKLK